MHDYLEIRTAHARRESIRSIARRLGRAEKTVRKAVHSESGEPAGYTRTKPVGYPKLGPFVPIIDQILRDDESAPPKQRHHAKRIFQRLKSEHGYAGSYYPVRRYSDTARQRPEGALCQAVSASFGSSTRILPSMQAESLAFPRWIRR